MSILTDTKSSVFAAIRHIGKTENSLSTVFERLSSGQRINRASNDAAGLAISESLNAQTRVYNQGVRNLNDGISILNIADGALAELTTITTRMQELATQASNGSYSSTQREALNEEAQALKSEFSRIVQSTEYNGKKLFDGSIQGGIALQAGFSAIQSQLGGVMSDGTFEDVSVISGSTNLTTLTTGDINGDGNIDFVARNVSSGELVAYFGNGSGGVGAEVTIDTPPGFYSIDLADIDNDGSEDIILGSIAGEVYSYINNGNGTFQTAITSSTGIADVYDVTTGDFNNDGIVDYFASHKSLGSEVYLGNGDGTFTLSDTLSGAQQATTGDFNGDGILDIATADAYSTEAKIYIGDGSGSFTEYALDGPAYYSSSVSVGDFNGDGLDDIISTDYYSQVTDLYISNGDGSFSNTTSVSGYSILESAAITDIDGDGNLDIVNAASASSVQVQYGNGDGTFEDGGTYASASSPRAIQLVDTNKDGVLDIVTDSATGLRSLLGSTQDGIAPILTFSLETQAEARQAAAMLENKLDSLSIQRGVIGASQSRLEYAVSHLSQTAENYDAASSRIRDADIAQETAQLVRLQILQQSATAVLAQANQQNSLILTLLGQD